MLAGARLIASPEGTRLIMRSERRTVLVLILLLWLIIKVVYLLRKGALSGPAALRDAFSGAAGVNQVLVVVVCVVLSYGVYRLLALARHKQLSVQVILAILCTIGFIAALAAYSGLVSVFLLNNRQVDWPLIIKETVVRGWAPFALYTAAALALIKSTEERLKDARSAALEVEVREEHLRALRMQLEPHFMCNSLGAVSTLILDGRHDEANQMVEKLAHFLRESAASCEHMESPLIDEFATVEAYLEIESLRFGCRLNLMLDCPEDIGDALVPNFILQPLVENSMKHAVHITNSQVTVAVSALRDGDFIVLTVEDDGPGIGTEERPAVEGIGMENTRSRIRMKYGTTGSVWTERKQPGFRTRIQIPYTTPAANVPASANLFLGVATSSKKTV